MKKITIISLMLVAYGVYAGGNNDAVKFPEAYKTEFTAYHTQNRAGKPQIVDLYANEVAAKSTSASELADGSKIIMEIYKAKQDEAGNPITLGNGLFEKGKFAAVAVMEKRSDWGVDYPAELRAGDWGFALYTPDGKPKENNLECQGCHIPFKNTDHMYSHAALLEFFK